MITRTASDSAIVTLRFAHGKASALDVELLEALDAELDDIRDARAIILTGTGSIFSAGVDLFRVVDGGDAYVRRFFPLLVSVFRKLFALPKPVVAAVNGHAIAGGCIMTLASDYKLMAAGNGRMGIPELLVGVPFPVTALEIVRFAVSPDRVQRVVFSGKTYLPDEALALGLVDEVVAAEELESRANAIATHLASLPGDAFRLAKQQLRAATNEQIDHLTPLVDAEALEMWSSASAHAQIREYLAKTVRKS